MQEAIWTGEGNSINVVVGVVEAHESHTLITADFIKAQADGKREIWVPTDQLAPLEPLTLLN